jgi:cell division protein FtsW
MNEETLKNAFKINLLIILIIGSIMVYSASYILASEITTNSYHFIIKQLAFISLGLLSAYFFSKTKFNFWLNRAYVLNFIAIILLVLTFIPGIGINIKGASRWISLGFINFQPSELMKITIIFTALKFFEEFNAKTNRENIIKSFNFIIPLLLLIKQPDFGSFSIVVAVCIFVCFMSSFPRKYFYTSSAVGLLLVGGFLFSASYRVKRLLVFLDPWRDPQNSGFQIIQSYLAFANGAITGQGLGNSQEKLFYLPEAYNDFIFSVIGEELGFIGVTFVSLLYLCFAFIGFKLALKLEKRSTKIFISAIVFAIVLQAYLNMGVVLGLLPTKGLNLPFISYGGSSMICNLAAIGFIFSALKSSDLGSADYRQQFKSNLYGQDYYNKPI